MSYSLISALALVLNIIINRENIKSILVSSKEQKSEQQVAIRYSYFLIVATCYFVVDIAWGILYAHHENDALFPLLYSDCVFYFIFMYLSMLT